jgi:hypothetical protein
MKRWPRVLDRERALKTDPHARRPSRDMLAIAFIAIFVLLAAFVLIGILMMGGADRANSSSAIQLGAEAFHVM